MSLFPASLWSMLRPLGIGLSAALFALTALPGDLLAYQETRSNTQASLTEISVGELPGEARHTLALIKQGGPYPFTRDGIPFGNRERVLPRRNRGYYHEYTVPTPGAKNRGARRIIAGPPGEYYYTDDHYRSFRRIKE